MEKINIVDPETIASFPEPGEWGRRRHFEKLVHGFHLEGLIHGDLRLANFTFTESDNPWRVLLVDFDWGGKDGG